MSDSEFYQLILNQRHDSECVRCVPDDDLNEFEWHFVDSNGVEYDY